MSAICTEKWKTLPDEHWQKIEQVKSECWCLQRMYRQLLYGLVSVELLPGVTQSVWSVTLLGPGFILKK